MRYLLLLGVLCTFSLPLYAQTRVDDTRLGNWNTLNFQYSFAPQWGFMIELQARLNQPFHRIFYYEQKGGLYFNINKNFQILVGTGHYATHDEYNFSDGPTQREFRIWQQLTINQYLARLKFEHRYRIEQRFINNAFAQRFRYRLNLGIPLNKETIETKTVYLAFFEELFLTNKAPYFMRNRAYGGIGYQVNKKIGFQIGITNQFNYDLKKSGGKNFLTLNMNIKLEEKAKYPGQLPNMD